MSAVGVRPLLIGGAAVLALLLMLTPSLLTPRHAGANDPVIVAEVLCDLSTNTYVIQYTSTAWPGDDAHRTNPQVEIYFDGVLVDTGAYSAPDFEYSGEQPVPAGAQPGDLVEVKTIAAGTWADGTPGGQDDATYVRIPEEPCDLSTGRFTGGQSNIRVDGAHVRSGLTIHCDLLLSNNLQVSWSGGNKFHMTEHLTTVECSDDPNIAQPPPAAPLDTLIGVGTGRFNGEDGYIVEFTLVDGGEPGSNDMMALKIYEESSGDIVLEFDLTYIGGGNLQAHYDQPHK